MLMKPPPQAGFTLIELSIVLVIIGLIVGGILVGQDLIAAASIRAQASQLQQFSSAFRTFQGKYGYLPGDIPAAEAVSVGLPVIFNSGVDYNASNGDGYYNSTENCGGNGQPLCYGWVGALGGYEQILAFPQLGTVGLTPNYSLPNTSTSGAFKGDMPYNANMFVMDISFPATKVNSVYGILPLTSPALGNNTYFVLGVIDGNHLGWLNQGRFAASLTPQQSYNLDSKIDDGMPSGGAVRAAQIVGLPSYDETISNDITPTNNCVTTGVPSAYNVTYTSIACMTAVRLQ